MVRFFVHAALVGTVAMGLVAESRASIILYLDQASGSLSNSATYEVTQQFSGIGGTFAQTFVPTLSAIDAFEMMVSADYQQQFQGFVRDGGANGAILCSSQIVQMPRHEQHYLIHFDLGSRVALIPGNPYALEIKYIANPAGKPAPSIRKNLAENLYTSGDAYKDGGLNPNRDLFFIEGLHSQTASVPEPSTGAIFVIGALCCGIMRVRSRRRRK